jgi:hypothetical protein
VAAAECAEAALRDLVGWAISIAIGAWVGTSANPGEPFVPTLVNRKGRHMKTKAVLSALLAAAVAATLASAPARAQTPGSDTKSILQAMSDYVSSQKTIELV